MSVPSSSGTVELTAAQCAVRDLAATLEALLRVRYADEAQQWHRAALAAGYIGNELRKVMPRLATPYSLEGLIAAAVELQVADIDALRNRCLFYACDDLITLLANKKIRGDAIAREEAVLYVQDRLQRDDFRRIRSFSSERGASFATYMWQVVNNLLLDFLRARSKHRELSADSLDAHAAGDIANDDTVSPSAEAEHSIQQLREALAELMDERRAADALHPVRERLRQHLKLTSKDRVFLKALFQYDLTMNEIRALPGFDMSTGEIYRFYYRIVEQLLEAFKDAGVLENMRALVSDAAPRVSLSIDGRAVTLAATLIYYLEQLDRRSTGCHAHWQDRPMPGVIDESFSKLCKRLSAYFTAIDAKTAVADRVLADTCAQWQERDGVFSIAGITRAFRIGKRQLTLLTPRFGKKESAAARI
jgi:hypothetical protein